MSQDARFLGAPILSLQTMLALLARAEPGIPTLTPDGIYGERTAHSVAAFQRSRGLPETGATDHTTWLHVVNAYYGALPDFEAACKRAGVPYTVSARPGMVHCYCMLPCFREAKEDFAKITDILKR